jgi:hypothetical protein
MLWNIFLVISIYVLTLGIVLNITGSFPKRSLSKLKVAPTFEPNSIVGSALTLVPNGDFYAEESSKTLSLSPIPPQSLFRNNSNTQNKTSTPSTFVHRISIMVSDSHGLTELTPSTEGDVLQFSEQKGFEWKPLRVPSNKLKLIEHHVSLGSHGSVAQNHNLTGSFSIQKTGFTTLNAQSVTLHAFSDQSVTPEKIKPSPTDLMEMQTVGTDASWVTPAFFTIFRPGSANATMPVTASLLEPFNAQTYELQNVMVGDGEDYILSASGQVATAPGSIVTLGVSFDGQNTTVGGLTDNTFTWYMTVHIQRHSIAGDGSVCLCLKTPYNSFYRHTLLTGIDWFTSSLPATLVGMSTLTTNSITCFQSSGVKRSPNLLL